MMTNSADPDRSKVTTSDVTSGAGPEASFWSEVKRTKVDLRYFLAFLILTPIAMFPLVWLGKPDASPFLTMADTLTAAWTGPALLVVAVVTVSVIQARQLRRVVVRQSSQAGAMLTSILAARCRHYSTTGIPDPFKAAVLDIGAYLRTDVPVTVAARWIVDGSQWYVAETAPGQLPSLPEPFLHAAKTILAQQEAPARNTD